jgi:hypothetical protein
MDEKDPRRKARSDAGEAEVQALTPANSAAWVEKYVAWASKVLDEQAKSEKEKN